MSVPFVVLYEIDKDEHQLKNTWRKYLIFEYLEPSCSEAFIKIVINNSIVSINLEMNKQRKHKCILSAEGTER